MPLEWTHPLVILCQRPSFFSLSSSLICNFVLVLSVQPEDRHNPLLYRVKIPRLPPSGHWSAPMPQHPCQPSLSSYPTTNLLQAASAKNMNIIHCHPSTPSVIPLSIRLSSILIGILFTSRFSNKKSGHDYAPSRLYESKGQFSEKGTFLREQSSGCILVHILCIVCHGHRCKEHVVNIS